MSLEILNNFWDSSLTLLGHVLNIFQISKGNVQTLSFRGLGKYLDTFQPNYAHIEVLVTFLLVKIFGFGVITRYPTMRF